MPKRSSKKKEQDKDQDFNTLTGNIVEDATKEEVSEEQEPEDESHETPKNPHAQALGRLGGLRGGKARAAKLTPQRRKEIARRAAMARWKKKKP